MNTKHTPSPWVVSGGIVKTSDGLYNVCDCLISYSLTTSEMEANARLIAASPCLLDAVANYLNPLACRQKTHEKLMAAFAKATGDAP